MTTNVTARRHYLLPSTVATGEVVHECLPRHRHQEFLRFLRKIERSVASELDIHVILDNYATHKHPAVRAWLDKPLGSTSTSFPLHPLGSISSSASSANSRLVSSSASPSPAWTN